MNQFLPKNLKNSTWRRLAQKLEDLDPDTQVQWDTVEEHWPHLPPNKNNKKPKYTVEELDDAYIDNIVLDRNIDVKMNDLIRGPRGPRGRGGLPGRVVQINGKLYVFQTDFHGTTRVYAVTGDILTMYGIVEGYVADNALEVTSWEGSSSISPSDAGVDLRNPKIEQPTEEDLKIIDALDNLYFGESKNVDMGYF